jgi:hypothetical protein
LWRKLKSLVVTRLSKKNIFKNFSKLFKTFQNFSKLFISFNHKNLIWFFPPNNLIQHQLECHCTMRFLFNKIFQMMLILFLWWNFRSVCYHNRRSQQNDVFVERRNFRRFHLEAFSQWRLAPEPSQVTI